MDEVVLFSLLDDGLDVDIDVGLVELDLVENDSRVLDVLDVENLEMRNPAS